MLAEKGNTPTAPRPCATTLTELARHTRSMNAYVIHHLTVCHMKTETHHIVRLNRHSSKLSQINFGPIRGVAVQGGLTATQTRITRHFVTNW